ncbi:MAG: FkbM family methyltransferase [Myxococcales bacterium]|nr:FkbM family methyltransferase [Myxococcales bacterium]
MTSLHAAKVRVAKLLCHPLVGRFIGRAFHDSVPNRGCRIDTSSPLVTPEVKAMLFWRLYEGAELRFVERYLRADLDVVELGASLGVMGSQIARKMGPTRQLVCVEANPALIPIIERNVRANASPSQRISIVHGAIGYEPGEMVSLVLGDATYGSHVGSLADARAVKVPQLGLSKLLSAHALTGPFALVSDIEGSELGVFENETEALARCQQLIIELHDVRSGERQFSAEQICQLAKDRHGFRIRDRHGPVVVFER